MLEEIRFPDPVISQALIPDKNVDETKLADALGKMVRDDPTLHSRTDPETNQLILSGMGELHLEVAVHKLQRDHGVVVTVGKPMVLLIGKRWRNRSKSKRGYIKQSGGRGKFACVIEVEFEPLSKEKVEEWTAYLEERTGDKKDPNNILFHGQDLRRRCSRRAHPVGGTGFPPGVCEGRVMASPAST